MVFTATCRGCYLLSLLMQELKISSAALHSHLTQNRRLAALEKCAPHASRSPVLLRWTNSCGWFVSFRPCAVWDESALLATTAAAGARMSA